MAPVPDAYLSPRTLKAALAVMFVLMVLLPFVLGALDTVLHRQPERNAALVERVAQFVVGTAPTMELSQPGWGWAMVAGMTSFWLALSWLLPRLFIRPT